MSNDNPDPFVAERRWGYMVGEVFRPLPKAPLEMSGHTQPPFYVQLPDGRVRYVIEEPPEPAADVIPFRPEDPA